MTPAMRERWIVKAGSNAVCTGGPLLLRDWMRQVETLVRRRRVQVVWVTSGAIATAAERVRWTRRRRTLADKQALSAVGQPLLMDVYNLALQAVGLVGAQILLGYDDLRHPVRCRNFRNTIDTLLSWGMIPILNENDALSTEEITFGDNDSLSARVAAAVGASRLVILTDVDGLHDRDPGRHPDAARVHRLEKVTPAWLKRAGGTGSGRGTGGMLSKLQAARFAHGHGIETWLARGDEPRVLLRIASGESIGTRIGGRR